MFLGRVKGHVVTTQKDPSMQGKKLLIVEPLRVDYEDNKTAGSAKPQAGGGGTFQVTGRAIVCVDTIGAGEGQLVMITQGSSARLAEGFNKSPVDAVIIGIVDEAVVMGKKIE